MKLFKAGDWVMLRDKDCHESTLIGDRRTFIVEAVAEISGGETLFLRGYGSNFWADHFDIIDEDPLGAK